MKSRQLFNFIMMTAILSTVVTGCGARVKSLPFDETLTAAPDTKKTESERTKVKKERHKSMPINGFVYGLPKTLIKVTVPYAIKRQLYYAKGNWKKDPAGVQYLAEIEEDIKIEPKAVLDKNMRFLVSPKALQNWRVQTSKASFKIENGILTSVNTKFEDKTGEIIKSLTKTGINVAKMVAAGADDATLREYGPLELVKNISISKVIDLSDTESITAIPKSEQIKKENIENGREKTYDRKWYEISVDFEDLMMFRPTTGEQRNSLNDSIDNIVQTDINTNKLFGLTKDIYIGYPILRFNCPTDPADQKMSDQFVHTDRNVIDKAYRILSLGTRNKTYIDGVAFRVPGTVAVNGEIAYRKLTNSGTRPEPIQTQQMNGTALQCAQFGRLGVLSFKSGSFIDTSRSINLDPVTGAVVEHDFTVTSRGEKMAKTLEEVSEGASSALPGLVKSGK